MVRPSSTALTMVAKLSSVRIMGCGFLGGLGAGDAHGDADVGRLERGRIADAVARHGDDPPFPCRILTSRAPCARAPRGHHADVVDPPEQLLVAHRGEFLARDGAAGNACSLAMAAAVTVWSPVIIRT